MKSNILKLLIFVLILVAFDRVIGTFCEKLYYKSNDYNIHRLRYTLDSTREDILIFGSSRAEYHFIPQIIQKNTGLSSYNCGFGGEGLLFSLIQLNESVKRYKPRIVVLEVSPNILIDPESQQKLKILMPFSKKDPLIYDALTHDEVFERVKLLFSIYPYNSTIASLITGKYKKNTDSLGGFMPVSGVIDTNGLSKQINTAFPTTSIPVERLKVLRQFIKVCNDNGIKLVVVVSPVFQTNPNLDNMTKHIQFECSMYQNLHFLNYSQFPGLYHNPVFFKDNLHLNGGGAKVFSEDFSRNLEELVAAKEVKNVKETIN